MPQPRSRRLVALLLACLATSIPRQAPAQAVLRVADQKGLLRALLDASQALDGISYHIEWSEFSAASPLLQALNAGAVDTGTAGDGPFLFASGAGQAVRATVAILPPDGGRAVAFVGPAGSPIRTVSDLAGHRIATTRGSTGHSLLLRLAQTDAVPASTLSVSDLSPSHAAAALRAGSIDGWVTWEPYVSIEETGGWRIGDGGHLLASYGFQVASITAIATKHALLPAFYAAIWSRRIGLPIDVSRKVAEEMRTDATRIDNAIIDADRVTIESYRQRGAAPAKGTDIAAAFDRSVTP